jgi:hypothetical protein
VLEERAGLTPAEAAQVRTAGQEYLRQLRRIDADARRQIAERFGPQSRDGRSAPPPGGRDPAPPLVIDSTSLPNGQTLQGVLADEGFIARLDLQKDRLLRAPISPARSGRTKPRRSKPSCSKRSRPGSESSRARGRRSRGRRSRIPRPRGRRSRGRRSRGRRCRSRDRLEAHRRTSSPILDGAYRSMHIAYVPGSATGQ